MNISETIKDINTHIVNSNACNLQVLHGMFKDVQCEHHWSHDTHQVYSLIPAKPVPALHCQWLKQLLLFVHSAHSRL